MARLIPPIVGLLQKGAVRWDRAWAMMMAGQMRPFGRGVGTTCGRPGSARLLAAMRPPFSFRSCRKENGPRPVQKKRTLGAEHALSRKFAYIREISESFPTVIGQSPTGSRRTQAFASLCRRVCQPSANFGVVPDTLPL